MNNSNLQQTNGNFNPQLIQEDKQAQKYIIRIFNNKRITIKKVKQSFTPRHDFGVYHKRKNDTDKATKHDILKQLRKWQDRLEYVDAENYTLRFVTLSTKDKNITFHDLRKEFKSLSDKITYHFKRYCGYIIRLEFNKKLYKHVHAVFFFDTKYTPKGFAMPWVQKNWKLGRSIKNERVWGYEGLKKYLCKIRKYEFMDHGKSKYSHYDKGMKLISTSMNLPKPKIETIISTDKNDGEKCANELNLKHKHEITHNSFIDGDWREIVDQTFYY